LLSEGREQWLNRTKGNQFTGIDILALVIFLVLFLVVLLLLRAVAKILFPILVVALILYVLYRLGAFDFFMAQEFFFMFR